MDERRLRQAQHDGGRVIRASEVGRYVYCAHAWWLGSVQGRPSAHKREMAAGAAVHVRHGRGVRSWVQVRRLAYAVLFLAAVIGVVWLIGWLGGGW